MNSQTRVDVESHNASERRGNAKLPSNGNGGRSQGTERLWSWLLVWGVGLTVLAHTRWGVSLVGWIAPVPWLRYLRDHRGWRPWLVLVGVAMVAWTLTVAKITTAPLSPMAALLFGIPMGLFFAVGYLVWDRLRRSLPHWASIALFPAAMVSVEWLQHMWTPFATWGAAAYTQINSLTWLQSA